MDRTPHEMARPYFKGWEMTTRNEFEKLVDAHRLAVSETVSMLEGGDSDDYVEAMAREATAKEALLAALPTEAVAWEERYKDVHGNWSQWESCGARAAYVGAEGYQHRALCVLPKEE